MTSSKRCLAALADLCSNIRQLCYHNATETMLLRFNDRNLKHENPRAGNSLAEPSTSHPAGPNRGLCGALPKLLCCPPAEQSVDHFNEHSIFGDLQIEATIHV